MIHQHAQKRPQNDDIKYEESGNINEADNYIDNLLTGRFGDGDTIAPTTFI